MEQYKEATCVFYEGRRVFKGRTKGVSVAGHEILRRKRTFGLEVSDLKMDK